MWVFARSSSLIAALVVAGLPVSAEAPERVVSLNLCTDLLALQLAPEQIIALSPIAHDQTSSPMTEVAAGYPLTDGSAEDVYLRKPDLVLAGAYTERATVDMLRRLGLRVEVFAPAASLSDIRAQVRRMGALLGREARAAERLAAFDAALERYPDAGPDAPRAIAYFANGYAPGRGTLVDAAMAAAGLVNVAHELGLQGGAMVSLEQLVVASPDLVVTGQRYPGTSRSEAILDHPAVRAASAGRDPVVVPDRDWICGTPHILAAIETLAQAGGTK